MNRTQAQLALLKYLLLTCAALFVFVSVSILDARPSDTSSESPSVVEQVVDVVGMVARVPAAIPNMLRDVPRSETPHVSNFQVWQPPCLAATTKLPTLDTDSGWVRVSTGICDRRQEILDSQLQNESNGFVATVFTPSHSTFTSDFIPLATGKNQMQMQLRMASGETYKYQWTIDRRPIVSN